MDEQLQGNNSPQNTIQPTIPTNQPTPPLTTNNKKPTKYIVIGIIILLLLAVGVFAYLKSGGNIVSISINTPSQSNTQPQSQGNSTHALINRGSLGSSASIAMSANGTKLVAVQSNGDIYTSNDSGAIWVDRGHPAEWANVASSADGTKLVALQQGAYNSSGISVYSVSDIYTSNDSGVTWVNRGYNAATMRNTSFGQSISIWKSVASSANGDNLVAVQGGSSIGDIFTSSDSGMTWVDRSNLGQWSAVASSANGTDMVAAEYGDLYTSTDSGATWTDDGNPSVWYGVASSANGSTLTAVSYGGYVYSSTNFGHTWINRSSAIVSISVSGGPASLNAWTAVASSANGATLVGIKGSKLYISNNFGKTWSLYSNATGFSSVAISSDGTKIAAIGVNGGIFTSYGGPTPQDNIITSTAVSTTSTTSIGAPSPTSTSTIEAGVITSPTGTTSYELGFGTCTSVDHLVCTNIRLWRNGTIDLQIKYPNSTTRYIYNLECISGNYSLMSTSGATINNQPLTGSASIATTNEFNMSIKCYQSQGNFKFASGENLSGEIYIGYSYGKTPSYYDNYSTAIGIIANPK